MSHPRWNHLLEWLAANGMDTSPQKLRVEARVVPGAGHGLFSLHTTASSVPLFTVPAKALLNLSTLSPHYPTARPPLTAVQLLSLHLLRFRPKGSQGSLDPLFGPYISILPSDFDFHPLTWLCEKRKSKNIPGNDPHIRLHDGIPPSVLLSLNQLFDRFHSDWVTICQYLRNHRDRFSQEGELLESDFLWAWLNVNTRCVYHRLKPSQSHPDNLTLCPILDFANHTTRQIRMTPRSAAHEGFRNKIGGNFTLLAPSCQTTQENDELYLTYGAHSNRKLFVEYGFVNHTFDDEGEVDVQESVEALFRNRGELGEWMKKQLVEHGYWGDWTLHSFPLPAHPSYRLVTALRLYHLFPPSSSGLPPGADDILSLWVRVLHGKRDLVSEENESAWRETLLRICEKLVGHAKYAINNVLPEDGENNPEWVGEMRRTIRILWEEELYVAEVVSESLLQGLQF